MEKNSHLISCGFQILSCVISCATDIQEKNKKRSVANVTPMGLTGR